LISGLPEQDQGRYHCATYPSCVNKLARDNLNTLKRRPGPERPWLRRSASTSLTMEGEPRGGEQLRGCTLARWTWWSRLGDRGTNGEVTRTRSCG
jgi:hypothetical protein